MMFQLQSAEHTYYLWVKAKITPPLNVVPTDGVLIGYKSLVEISQELGTEMGILPVAKGRNLPTIWLGNLALPQGISGVRRYADVHSNSKTLKTVGKKAKPIDLTMHLTVDQDMDDEKLDFLMVDIYNKTE